MTTVYSGQCAIVTGSPAVACPNPSARHSPYCANHAVRLWRHGHPLQTAVTFKEVMPYVCHAAEAITSRPDSSDVWRVLEARWSAYFAAAHAMTNRGIYADPELTGITMRKALKHEVEAAKAIDKTMTARTAGRSATPPKPREIIANVLALILMREVSPERFEDGRAFLFQVARRFLCLNPVNATKTNARKSSVYKPLKAKAMEFLGSFLMTALGQAGVSLVASVRHGLAEVEASTKAYQAVVASLSPPLVPLFPKAKGRGVVAGLPAGIDPETGLAPLRPAHLKWLRKVVQRQAKASSILASPDGRQASDSE